MELYTGTSGFSYKEWRGPFYPEDLSSDEMLAWYGSRLSAVEINNTFYRMPKDSVLDGWAGEVPAGFRFSIKASRKITHFGRLKPDTEDATAYLVNTVGTLRERLGALLFQLPPNFKADRPLLEAFLGRLPEGLPVAFEFRHDSWWDDAVHDLLRERGVARVVADTDDDEEDAPVAPTTDWGYLRLRRSDYGAGDLDRWAQRLRDLEWTRAYVFFKHEDEGAGPRLAMRFRERFEGEGGAESPAPS